LPSISVIFNVIPFIKKVIEKFKNILGGLKSNLVFFSLNKLGRIIKTQKDTLPTKYNKNVVYKLSCKDCHMLNKQRGNLTLE